MGGAPHAARHANAVPPPLVDQHTRHVAAPRSYSLGAYVTSPEIQDGGIHGVNTGIGDERPEPQPLMQERATLQDNNIDFDGIRSMCENEKKFGKLDID